MQMLIGNNEFFKLAKLSPKKFLVGRCGHSELKGRLNHVEFMGL